MTSHNTRPTLRQRFEATQRDLWAAQRKIRDLVDHIALLRSPQVTHDDILRSQLEATRRKLNAAEDRLSALARHPQCQGQAPRDAA